MAEKGTGEYFISDADDGVIDDADGVIPPPVILPVSGEGSAADVPQQPQAQSASPQAPPAPAVEPAPAVAPAPAVESTGVVAYPEAGNREERLADVLNHLMHESPVIEAAALVSLDGFIMASALPEGVQEDRLGAMSAAILGLGNRAAAELGRGNLSQVFIEGAHGYVILMAAGDRAVLTVIASRVAKLGLVFYDMQGTAESIADILS